MRATFPLFQTHLDLAHAYWLKVLKKDSFVIDATCGNGYDSLFVLQNLVKGQLFVIDIQEKAIESAKSLIKSKLGEIPSHVHFSCRSHESFPEEIKEESVSLIIYNLGYLPRSDKQIKTKGSSTLKSIEKALKLLKKGGLLSITCYSGHREGAEEEELLKAYLKGLNPLHYSYSHHFFYNRRKAPSLIFIQSSDG